MLIFTLGTMRNPRATAFGGRSAFRRRTHASPTSSETKTPPKYHLKTHEENRKTFALRTGGSRAGLLLYRQGGKPGYVSREALASGFVTPPDSIQTSVYWYWISNNISKEGVVKDLESMKKAGINRAFIGNIGQDDVPYGNVKMLSDEWWDVLHTALKKATELDIEIGIFNSPGWSQSGGPVGKARTGDALSGLVGNPSKRSPEGQPQTR